ncbi:hypothetical protein GCK32_012759 [Trichostrongylus colubriformis]|uniref:Uncharacterized protein n=1 Tax=Trichostrongylus colubriformis TaxID=6319 RepID=A0AAN8G3V1_TRICO
MYPAFVLCMAVQVYAYGRNQSPTTPEAVPAEKTAPPPAPAPEPAREPKAPLPPEEPGPGDFLDEFAKRLVGYTVKELQTSSDPYLLNKDGTPELSKFRTKMYEWEHDRNNVGSKTKYEVLLNMKLYLEFAWIRLYTRGKALDKMLEFWLRVDSDTQQELRSEFSAFELFA